jgi:hypothetical protein
VTVARAALAAAAAIGPFFAWEPGDPAEPPAEPRAEPRAEPPASGPSWRPFTDLLDGDVTAERVAVARSALTAMAGLAPGEVPVRVVASVTFLGVAARVLSPLLGAAVAGGALPLPGPGDLWWRAAPGPLPLRYRELDAVPCAGRPAAEVAARLVTSAIDGLVRPLLEAYRNWFLLSPQVLWGNVASALGGAAGMLADTAPQHAERAGDVVAAMLAIPPLAGTATLQRPDPARARRFLVRRNCCLYYRIPGGGTCGDCVLTPVEDRRRQWQSVLELRTCR